jgi:hypothetical protein
LNFAKTCPIGLRSGEYFGRKTRLALQDADLGLRRREPGKVALQIRLPLTDIRNGQLLPFRGAESGVRQPSVARKLLLGELERRAVAVDRRLRLARSSPLSQYEPSQRVQEKSAPPGRMTPANHDRLCRT